jgi:AcrR family transcriptional regulator
MKPTSTHIADHALKLFNNRGFVNVRLQHIADAAFVSVGHLAYHIKNKDTVIDDLFDQHRKAYENVLQSYRVMPLFEDFNTMLEELFSLQERFSFIYTDALELSRSYPALAEKYRNYSSWQRVQFEIMLGFHFSRGALQMPNQLVKMTDVAALLQNYIETWRYRKIILGKDFSKSQDAFTRDTWQFLLPYCSPQGLAELEVACIFSAE